MRVTSDTNIKTFNFIQNFMIKYVKEQLKKI